MPTQKTLEEFIKAVEQGPTDLAMEQFYAYNASIQENEDEPRFGKAKLLEHERKMLGKTQKLKVKCIRPYFMEGDKVIIRWQFRMEWKNHTVSELDELVYQEWEGEKIKREKFFYDPKQLEPKKLS